MYHIIKDLATLTGTKTTGMLPFTPNRLCFTVVDGETSFTSGEATSSTNQFSNCTYFDVNPLGETLSAPSCLKYYKRQNGVLVPVLELQFLSWRTNGFKVNVITPNTQVKYFVECFA